MHRMTEREATTIKQGGRGLGHAQIINARRTAQNIPRDLRSRPH